jgi:type VI secretion system Hcp family effector
MKKMIISFLAIIAIAFSNSLMAQATKIFMNMGSEIVGTATDKGFEHNLKILSYSQGASSCSQVASKGGLAACKVSSSDFSFMMEMDRSIIKLKEYIYNGKTIPLVVVSFVKAGGDAHSITYYKITLTNVIITALQESGSSETPTVSFSLSPTAIAWEYIEQNSDGQQGTPLKFSWDLGKSRSF